MHYILFSLLLILACVIIQLFFSAYCLWKGRILSKAAFPREKIIGSGNNPVFRVLIGGDSVGVGIGIGASGFDTSFAGRIANNFQNMTTALMRLTGFIRMTKGMSFGLKC